MIHFLDGKIIQCFSDSLIVSVNSIGYLVHSHNRFLNHLQPDQEIRIHTYQTIKDDAIKLFGFAYPEERDFFTTLIQVSGFGPKLALSLLSSYPPGKIAQFVYEDDIISLTAVNGLGKKGAQRLILELKDKIQKFLSSDEQKENTETSSLSSNSQLKDSAVLALKKLGFSDKEALSRVSKVIDSQENNHLSVQELIRLCFIQSGEN